MELPEYREDADWIIRLRPMKGFAAPAGRRMARLVKSALRCFGFRTVTYYQPHAADHAEIQRRFDSPGSPGAK